MLLIIALEHQEQTGAVLDKPEHMVALRWCHLEAPCPRRNKYQDQIPRNKYQEWEERLSVRKLISAGWE